MFIRLILPCAIAVSASFASLNTAQAQPCSSNFTSAGVPMLSEISYRSWDLVKNPPAKAISAAARNPVLAAVYQQVNARLQALRFRSNQDEAKWKRAMKEHERMIEALATHDGAAMREVLLTHLENKRDVVLEQLRAERSAQGAAQ